MSYRLTSLLYRKQMSGGVVGLYNNIWGHNFAFVPDVVMRGLDRGELPSEPDRTELANKHFLVPSSFSEIKYVEDLRRNQHSEIHLMYLLLTQSCNLSCSYCFERLASDPAKLMPWPVAERAIDCFFNISKPNRTIIFYGGEPLLNPDVLIQSVVKIRAHESAAIVA